jgi:hypothetical protein
MASAVMDCWIEPKKNRMTNKLLTNIGYIPFRNTKNREMGWLTGNCEEQRGGNGGFVLFDMYDFVSNRLFPCNAKYSFIAK